MTIIYLAFYILLLVCSPAQAISFDEARRHHQQIIRRCATMKKHRRWDQLIIMTYGEFGHRPKINLSKGTDHGTTAPHFILGGPVKVVSMENNLP